MLVVINGPMFAGKTSMLISMAKANEIAEKFVTVFKPSNDTRSAGEIVTHNKESYSAVVLDKDDPVISSLWTPDVALLDEVQFFNKQNILKFVNELTSSGIEVVCAGLSMDSEGRPFGAMPELLSIADDIINLKAVCSKCKRVNAATRTYRKNGNIKEQILVGGKELYEARCYNCWI